MNSKPTIKAKTKTKIKLPVLSRLTQKTFIVITALYFVASVASQAPYYLSMFQAKDKPPFSLDLLVYPLLTVIPPLLIFIVVYLMSSKKVTKLWRVTRALIITVMAMIFYAFASMIILPIFSSPLGYGNTPAVPYNYLIELIPYVLAAAVAIVLSLVLSKSKDDSNSDASPLLQKLFVIFAAVFGLGQPFLALAVYGGYEARADLTGLIASIVMSIAVPAAITGVLYVITSKQRSIRQRLFISAFYVTLGVFLSMLCSALPYAFITPTADYFGNNFVIYAPIVAALVIFAAIVTWHKIKKAL